MIKKFRVDKPLKINAAAIADKLFLQKYKEEDKVKKKNDKIVSIMEIQDYKENGNQSKNVRKKVKFEDRINDILSKLFYTHQTIDNIIEYWKQHRADFNVVTENWIRNSIYGEDNLDYYRERMSKVFGNYRDVEENMFNTDSANEDETTKNNLKAFKNDIKIFIKRQWKIQNRKNTQKKVKKNVVDEPIFNALKKKEWILDWNCVMFKNGYMVIYAQSSSNVKFKPLKTYVKGSMESFNYLKKYLSERLPPVHCEIVGLELRIIDEIKFNEAIQQFAIAARLGIIKIKQNGVHVIDTPQPMSFSQALSKAKQMTPEDFQKYKSKYIDYLVTLQSRNYKVIPCVERLAHANSDSTEYAFLFSIECSSDKILIVHENVNPDRSTLLFLIEKNSYDRSIISIYDFLQSAEINKRSNIRERSISYHDDDIIDYKSINHDDLSSWKRAIKWYFKIAINIPRKRIDITKMKFTSFNQLLKGIQADDNYKEVLPILERYGIPTNRKLKPADILERIPNSICTIDKDGRKILPISNGQWTLEKIIKLIKYC